MPGPPSGPIGFGRPGSGIFHPRETRQGVAPTHADGCYSAQVVADAAVFYLRVGESAGTNANDEIGTADGTYTGGFTLGQASSLPGDPNTAVLLNGTTGWIQVVAPSWVVGAAGTIECWVKRTATGGAVDQRLYDRAASGDPQLIVQVVSANDKWSINSQSGGAPIAESTSTLDTNWHHLVWTWDGARHRMWQDGVDVTGAVTHVAMGGATGDLAIGRHRSAASNFFNGSIDEYAVYGYALSAAQVASHYAAAPVACSAVTPYIPQAQPDEDAASLVDRDDTAQAWPVAPPLAIITASFVGNEDEPFLTALGQADETVQSYPIQPVAAAAQTVFVPNTHEPPYETTGSLDDTVQPWSIQPPASQAVTPTGPWTATQDVAGSEPSADDTVQSWAIRVQTPFVANVDEAFAPGDFTDDTQQAWTVRAPAAVVFDPSTGFPWTNTPDDGPQSAFTDDTIQPWAVQPVTPPTTPFDPAAGFPWPTVDADAFSPSTSDDTIQPWAIGPSIVPVLNRPDEPAGSIYWFDDTSQAWTIVPPVAAVSVSFAGNQPELQQPSDLWADDTRQPWAVSLVTPPLITPGVGGYGPGGSAIAPGMVGSAIAPAPQSMAETTASGGSAQDPTPTGNASGPTPRGSASNPTPRR